MVGAKHLFVKRAAMGEYLASQKPLLLFLADPKECNLKWHGDKDEGGGGTEKGNSVFFCTTVRCPE